LSLNLHNLFIGNTFKVKIHNNEYILANDLLKVGLKEEGVLRSYDPGYMNTINCVKIKGIYLINFNIWWFFFCRHLKSVSSMETKVFLNIEVSQSNNLQRSLTSWKWLSCSSTENSLLFHNSNSGEKSKFERMKERKRKREREFRDTS